MNILEKIIECKKREIEEKKRSVPEEVLKGSVFFERETLSLTGNLLNGKGTGIIAEFKRRSPSKGMINDKADVVDVTSAYARYGASGLSVLTDGHFFGGTEADLQRARVNKLPVLRKDFIIDEYQLVESRAMGADVILLIAACLSTERVKELTSFARHLHLEVLLELHQADELGHICEGIELVGVNNRDLKTFAVDINRSIELGRKIPGDKIRIAESGIKDADSVHKLREEGFKGFLIGEQFMRTNDPGNAFKDFVHQLSE